jgi:hypothetical protein
MDGVGSIGEMMENKHLLEYVQRISKTREEVGRVCGDELVSSFVGKGDGCAYV